jgi:hypothetical protein
MPPRLAYSSLFILSLIAIFEVWSQVGGQGHLDLVPWYLKLFLGVAAAFATVKAVAASASREQAWNSGTLKWVGILLAVLIGCVISTYYMHVYGEQDEDDPDETANSYSRLAPPEPPAGLGFQRVFDS